MKKSKNIGHDIRELSNKSQKKEKKQNQSTKLLKTNLDFPENKPLQLNKTEWLKTNVKIFY